MNDLLQIKNNEAVCTSLQIAEKFGKRHDHVIRDIENLLGGIPKSGETYFRKSSYTNEQNGQKYPMYYMNRDGFSLLVMGFKGKKALEWKLNYIRAFNQMETMLKERNSQLWLEQRRSGKLTRQAETDVIRQLVEYAKEQGSKHSQMLYMTYSKLANTMVGIKERDSATINQLNELTFIENIILHQICVGMERQMHYKDIYQDCKRQIEMFKDVAYLNVG